MLKNIRKYKTDTKNSLKFIHMTKNKIGSSQNSVSNIEN